MSKNTILAILPDDNEAESYYANCGPGKHTQEEHYTNGVSVVQMNVKLLEDWLEDHRAMHMWDELTTPEQREIWDKSKFHFGIHGYDSRDADYFWSRRSD